MKYRYAIQLSNAKWVSIKNDRLYSSNGVGRNKDKPPYHYTSSNIFEVLKVRQRILDGEEVYRSIRQGVFKAEKHKTCRCVKIGYETAT